MNDLRPGSHPLPTSPTAAPGGIRHAVRDLVVIACSSRGGSSVFAEILRHGRGLAHFRAEVNPFFLQSGLSFPSSGTGSDRLDAPDPADGEMARRLEHLDTLLADDVGEPCDTLADDEDLHRYATALQTRFALQWPGCTPDFEVVLEWLVAALREAGHPRGAAPLTIRDPQALFVRLLVHARAEFPAINPYYYDLPPALVRDAFPGLPVPQGPPGPVLLEEPPFVAAGPWRRLSPAALARRPLVVKTPSNVYRLPFLQALFPNARIRVLHLTRNAAAAINGLVDGWRFRGFFSHHLPGRLRIAGYTDTFPDWGADWWKFDLPPGWEAYTDRTLPEVCGYQWRSAHEATLATLEAPAPPDHFRLRFEDVVGSPDVRVRAFGPLADWLGIPYDDDLTRVVEHGLPPIMATERPRHRRWFEKAALLEPVLSDPALRTTMERLGYDHDPSAWL